MDFKVYTKESVKQPSGTEYIVSPNIIDLIPVITTDEGGNEVLSDAEILTEENDIVEQMCMLSTIYQKGLDPLAEDEGVRWSEALLGEISVIQLMEDLTNAVAEVTPTVEVTFSTVKDDNGNEYLKYTLQAVA